METNGTSTGAKDAGRPEATEPAAVIRTFLIADVRGYTRFTQAHGDEEAGRLAMRFAALAREVVTGAGGELIELRGDEALSVFPSARQALRAAVELQRRFRERVDGEPAFPLGIGIGLDAGEAVPVEDGYRGGALNLAARLCALAAPGQILASETVTSLARTLEEVRFVERRARVKGLEKPVRLIEVVPKEELPPVPEAPRSSRRRPALLIAGAGAVILAASLTAAVLALTGESDDSVESVGNAIAAIDGGGDAISYTQVGNTPSTIAVGEGAVWVLNADDRTISKLDPKTRQVLKTFGTGGVTTDLAVGEGAVWVGNGAETPGPLSLVHTASISAFDPDTTSERGTEPLPELALNPAAVSSAEARVLGVSQLAVGAGAVWAINPDRSVSRIDPDSGTRVATVRMKAGSAIAAGDAGVWALDDEGPTVVQIDPRTNKVGRRIELGTDGLTGLAVGAGSVWATDLEAGVLWRIDPRPDPITRTIDVGFGVTAVAYGGGAVWVTNFVRDEIVRIDARSNGVTARIPLAGTPPSVAATDETAWVSVAGAPRGDTLPASACGPVVAGSKPPDVLIGSDLPLQTGDLPHLVADAIRFVLEKEEFRAGEYSVGYQSCDNSTAQTGFDAIKCASNAKAYAGTAPLVGVIGPFNSQCAWAQIPITNRAAGPLAMISPSTTYPGLTHAVAVPGYTKENEPEIYYPTGTRNYVRDIAPEDFHAAGGAVLAQQLGVRRLFVLQSAVGSPLGPFVDQIKATAPKLGVTVVGSAKWPEAKSYAVQADRVARTRPDGIYFPDLYFEDPNAVLNALRDQLGQEVVLITNDSAGHAEPGMYVTTTARANESLGPAGRRFLREFRATQPDGAVPTALYIAEAAQAADALLRAIARSDGTRASVTRELRGLQIEDGILGTFGFDENGDMTPATISVFRITGKRQADAPDFYGGADFDRLVQVPPELLDP
jgi:branched-chain amino acid transport system substrate-binding protein